MTEEQKLDAAKEAKAQVAAFSEYLEEGIEVVKKHFPDQVSFVLQNKDKSYAEVIEYCNRAFAL